MAENEILIAIIYILLLGLIIITTISFVLSIIIVMLINKDIKTKSKNTSVNRPR